MQIRYFIDPETEEPHIYDHGVTEDEVEFVLRHPGKIGRGVMIHDMHWDKLRPDDTYALSMCPILERTAHLL